MLFNIIILAILVGYRTALLAGSIPRRLHFIFGIAITFVVQIAAVSEKNGTTVISISHLEVDMEVNPLLYLPSLRCSGSKNILMALNTCTVIQCCGCVSGIRCLFDPWIRDPGWVKNQDPDPG
jgi:hypothetical protein